MESLFNQHKSTRLETTAKTEFILPLIISVGLIPTVGGFALLTRVFGGFMGSIRSEQARQTREIA